MGDEVVARVGPAYNVYAWNSGESGGPQCSQWGDYCYLCQTAERPRDEEVSDGEEEDDGDYVGMLKAMVRSMVR